MKMLLTPSKKNMFRPSNIIKFFFVFPGTRQVGFAVHLGGKISTDGQGNLKKKKESLPIYFERGFRERRRVRIPSRLHAQLRAQLGTRSQHREIVTQAKIKSRSLNWLNHSGALTGKSWKWINRNKGSHSYRDYSSFIRLEKIIVNNWSLAL